jgi:aspartyl-tRNA(Asn)/glutamyl-tRNA(Gln) amidotransferase subunit B
MPRAAPRATIRWTRLKIGMEVHVELSTRSKMFTRAPNVAHPDHYDAPPNGLVDPLVAALPGTLPVPNRRAIEMAVMVGLALECRVAEHSRFDRKNYFYPDLPKGYQISQYDLPLSADGHLEITLEDGSTRRVGIIRAHLEEDAGKLGHELPGGLPYDGSLVDLNRAGTPLLEIVSHPDMESADEAVAFGQALRNLCRFLGVSEGVMQRGHMRFEPNINLLIGTDDGRERATPVVEVKNLNSFKALRAAIEHERIRQAQQWLEDGRVHGPGMKQTRGWDDVRQATVLQRDKEEAHDYRYFPDPDLPPIVIDDAWRAELAARIPELPLARRRRYQRQQGLSAEDARVLTDERDLCLFYEACVDACQERAGSRVPVVHPAQACAKLLLNTGARLARQRGCSIPELGIAPPQVAGLLELRDAERIGSSAADELFARLCQSDQPAEELAAAAGLLQVRDESELAAWVEAAVAAQPQASADFAAGKDKALGRLVGEVMKRSGGKAEAAAVQRLLQRRLRS